MGQAQTKNIKQDLAFNEKQWRLLSADQYGQKCNNLYQNLKMEIWAERTTIICDPLHKIQQQLEIYHYRKNQDNAIVNVYVAQYQINTDGPFCGNNQQFDVVYERIPARLSRLPALDFQYTLYVLSQSIRGFKECFQKVGFFKVTQNMIGFNSKGFVKVWLNQNLAQNHPSSQKPSLQVTTAQKFKFSAEFEQQTMLQNVINVVESKCKEFPRDFNQAICKQKTFANTYCQIKKYVQDKKLWIPDRIPLQAHIENFKDQNSQIADFKNEFKKLSRVESRINKQHANYLQNLEYEYPRNTYLNLTCRTNGNSKPRQKEMIDQKSMNNQKSNPVIYENRPSVTILQNVAYPQPRLKQTEINYPVYYFTGKPK